MKTSNIILISFFSVIGIFLLSLMIQAEPKKVDYNRPMGQMKTETHTLPKFSHLKVGRGCYLLYTQANGDSIHYSYPQETKFEKPVFEVRGDTLFVRNSGQKNLSAINVYASSVNSIRVDSSHFEITAANTPALHISAKTSTVKFQGNTIIDTAYLKLKDCTLLGSQAKIKKLETEMDHVEIRYDR